nr:reverse transcriptase domain-containing protein [Tanacetum cinerariifolium]
MRPDTRNYSEKMSAMANTTPIVTTVTKTATKEKAPNGAEIAPGINILDFCEEHYKDILPVMDKIHRDKRREVHIRLDFGENSRKSRRMREDSPNSSAKTLSAKYHNPSERRRMRDHLRNNDGNVFSRPDREYSRDDSYSRGRPHKRNSSPSRDCPRSRGRSSNIEESYGNTYSSYKTEDKHRYYSHGTGRSSSMKRGRNSESPLSRVTESGTNEGGHWKLKSKRRKPTDEEDLAVPWSYEEVGPFTPRIRNFKSSRKTRMPNNVKTYDETGDPEDHVKNFQAAAQVERWAMPTWCHLFNSTLIGTARVWFDELPPESIDGYTDLKAAFLAYFMQQKKYVKDPVEIHNIKQTDGETIKEFMERFKIENGRINGAPECMRISGFMHGVNNRELIKTPQ